MSAETVAQPAFLGAWSPGNEAPIFEAAGLLAAVDRFREPCFVIGEAQTGRRGIAFGGSFVTSQTGYGVLATLPGLYPEWLGDRSFGEAHRVRFPYATGAMANGIATADLVIEAAKAGCMSFFGAAGLTPDRIAPNLEKISAALDPLGASWGANLIHSPQEPALEAAVTDLYLRTGVRRIEASAFMGLTPSIVRYAYSGVRADGDRIQRINHVFAKISRPEVAKRFLEPAPASILEALVQSGGLTAEEAAIAAHLPVAEDLTAEADSGGHTDNQALSALLPTILRLRDEIAHARGYRRPIRVGAAGGLGTPAAVAAAFTLGAAYALTGSVNQACVESGLSSEGKRLLADAKLGDFVMAAAADMFEMGVRVQVLQRGTMFASRAKKLYELYVAHSSLEALSASDRQRLEQDILRKPVAEAWNDTAAYWRGRDPHEIEKAERDPKHKMALVFRSYLGQSSRWAIAGDASRRTDYQIWCGPAMGAFNAWTAGTFLSSPERRTVAQVSKNLLEGAAAIVRAQSLRSAGAPLPAAAFDFRPRLLS
jgi:trans-AT polyketide synthase, acyltransferase and oxidoreductase domains